MRIQKITHTIPHYWRVEITKSIGAKFEITRDGAGKRGLYVFVWMPRDRGTRRRHNSFWFAF